MTLSSEGGARRLFLTGEGEPRAFVIVSSARSGSNLLVSYLRQVSRLDMPPQARDLHRSDPTAF